MGLGEGEMVGLDLKLCTVKSINGFLKEAVDNGDGRVEKMEELVKLLEEEKAKIKVFKRELPLCMHLIGDVIEGLKDEVEKCRVETKKSKLEDEEETDRRDKMSWMSSAQLWSDNYTNNNNNNTNNNNNEKKMLREVEKKKSASLEINVNGAGAFTPFKGVTAQLTAKKEESGAAITAAGLPDLSLLSPAMRSPQATIAGAGDGARARVAGRGPVAGSVAAAAAAAGGAHLSLQPQAQGTPSAGAGAGAAAAAAAARKARRCWSPELHRRFVMALEHLGGAQATPKQIRELMKVDGLTNDEVKSHLQKYRLHTRRMPSTAPNVNPPVMVVGGLWMHQQQQQDQDTASQQSTSQSGSPQGPLQFNSHGRALSMTTTTNGDSCEEEDGRSESYSWK